MAENNRPSDQPNPADPRKPNDKPAPQDDDAIDLSGSGSILDGSSGVIPLSELTKPGSSNAVFSWADIIGIPPAPGEDGDEGGIKFDAISDKDLLQRIVEEEKAAGRVPPALPVSDIPARTETDLSIPGMPAQFPGMPPVESGSAFIFPETGVSGGSSVSLDEPILKHGSTASGSVVKFDIPKPPADAGGFMPKTMHDTSLPPVPPTPPATMMFLPSPTQFEIPPVPAGLDSDDDLVKTPSIFPAPKGTDADNIFSGIANNQVSADFGGSDIVLGDSGGPKSGSAAEHSSILDILLGDQEVQDAIDKSKAADDHLDFGSSAGFGGGNVSFSDLHDDSGWGGGASLPTFLTPPSQPDFQMPDVDNPTFLKSSKPSTPSLPPAPPTAQPPAAPTTKPAAPVRPGAAWLTPVSSEFDMPPTPPKPAVPATPPTAMMVPPVPSFGGPPEFDESTASGESFNPEEAVDLLSEGPVGTGISESGSLQISEEEIEAANRRSRMMESSAIDLSAHPSIAGLDLEVPEDLPSFRPTPSMEDVPFPGMSGGEIAFPTEEEGNVDLGLPGIGPDDSRVTPREDLLSGFSDPDTDIPPPARPLTPNRTTPIPAARNYDDFDDVPAPRQIVRPPVDVSTGQIEMDTDALPATRVPAKKGGWVMPGLIGLVLGAGGIGGAYFAGALPPLGDEPSTPIAKSPVIPKKDPVVEGNPDNVATLMASGKLDEAVKAYDEMAKTEPKSPTVLTGRGVARWQLHLQNAAREGMQPGAKTDDTNLAMRDLEQSYDEWTAANKPADQETAAIDAAVYRGQIYEVRNDANFAMSIYEKASKDVSDASKGIFEAHKARLKVLQRTALKGPDETMRLDARELIPLTILLQADPKLKGSGELAEAGQGFWLALDKASEGKYAEAKTLLQQAIAKHKIARAANPGKRLNPTTDPNEQIFEISCMQLMEYWDLKARGPKVVPSPNDPKEVATLKQEIAALEKAKTLAETSLAEAKVTNKELMEMSKTFETANKELATKLVTSQKEIDDKKTMIATLNEEIKTRDKKLLEYADVKKTVDEANEAKKKAELALKTSEEETKKVADALAKVQGENKTLLEFVQGKANIAEKELDPAVKQLVKAYEEAKTGKASPRERLDVLLQLMMATDNEAQAKRASDDADKILTETKDEEYIAKATAVKALAQRNLQNYVESRKLFDDASKLPGFKANEFWGKSVTDGLDSLKSPEKFAGFSTLTPSGADLLKELTKVERAMKAFPKDLYPKEYAVLVARRGAIKLDQNVNGADADANDAIAGGAEAEGKLILARIAERKGDYAAAITLFKQAQDAAKDNLSVSKDAMLGVVRSRLLQIHGASGAPPKAPATPNDKQTRVTPGSALILSVLLLDGETSSNFELQTAISALEKLIADAPADQKDELIADQKFLQALAMATDPIKARAALELFVEGLNKRKLVPADHVKTLNVILDQIKKGPTTTTTTTVPTKEIVKDHKTPVPTPPTRPSVKCLELAERTFNEGYRLYFHGDYFGAEASFLKSIANADDARFFYYLALAQTAQGRDAGGIFARANELERSGAPEVKLINDSLERVQGEARKMLELKRP